MDQMVLRAQRWVNATYGSVAGYNRCAEDGNTGWQTIFSLTRALQVELGITALSDNFGPATFARLSAYGPVGVSSSNMNMRKLAEAALYCKGYNGGVIDGAFDPGATQIGLTSLVRDMGLPIDGAVRDVTPKVFKALLTMDAFVMTAGGSDPIRVCQQWLNGTYIGKGQFFIGPADGHFSRNVQVALIYAIQYQLGMTDSQVTGFIGPGTRDGLQRQAYVYAGSTSAQWIRLFQCALAFNNYANRWEDGGGTFPEDLARIVKVFQRFCMLAETGAGDYRTWMSLLVSTGDPDRPGKAIDCAIPLNSATIRTVKEHGYEIAGRYLNGGTNKVLTHSEIALIIGNGLSFFPIYQEWGDGLQHFNYDQGRSDATAAVTAARGFGIPWGTTIYFSVDFDAQDHEITSAIIPHFRGVQDAVAADGGMFSVGVYGCRNVCLRLESAGLAGRSFVSGMSTGYSGNLGFKLPANWAFDQIRNMRIGVGTPGEVEIDNDIVSNRDRGVSGVNRPPQLNDGFFTMMIWFEARAGQWRAEHPQRSGPELVAQFLRMRSDSYKFRGSDTVFGELDRGFISFVREYDGRPDDYPLRDPNYLWDCDVDHFGATFGGVLKWGLPDELFEVNLADLGGWAGDALSVLGQWQTSGLGPGEAYAFARQRFATRADNSYMTMGDWFADVDAFVLGQISRQYPDIPLSQLFRQHYATPASAIDRFHDFYQRRFGGRADYALLAAENMFGAPGDKETEAIRDAIWLDQGWWDVNTLTPVMVHPDARNGVARAFAETVVRFAYGE
ncbi:glycoside hydrolase domain-containing protein [Actinoplanes sp. NPDC049596]|uniref:glycoside hydrolase domain-containing protein n=1 Tax=unclassified Actinoplanes TaxID=2626549 RepID=UPI003440CCA4